MIFSPTFNVCPICGILRNKRVHSKCSKILQKQTQTPAYKAECETIRRNARGYDRNETIHTKRISRIRAATHRIASL
ncbi:hypothetical protein [Klebsiella phage pKP-BM327-1.2]|nr:hypothetical protein [Klebsiella phage pKP-BM327-1.2]